MTAVAEVERAAARILRQGRRGLAARPEWSNVASATGLAQYRAVAAEVAARAGGRQVLDWGAGWGQTSLLLAAHGLAVTAYDVEDKGAAESLLAGSAVRYVVAPGPALPFGDQAFDAILNCGVLEHVEDPVQALAELHRVLRPGGLLFTYHLPNRHSAAASWAASTTTARTPRPRPQPSSRGPASTSRPAGPSTSCRGTPGPEPRRRWPRAPGWLGPWSGSTGRSFACPAWPAWPRPGPSWSAARPPSPPGAEDRPGHDPEPPRDARKWSAQRRVASR